MVDIEAVLEFFADNPPSILILGGFLCVIIGAGYQSMGFFDVSRNLYIFGAIGIFAGIALQIWWLERR
jgi:hypothetical protein